VFLLSPKSYANPWSESGDQGLDLRELTCGLLFIPCCPSLTGLTSASHRSDRCKALVIFPLGERPSSCGFGPWFCWLVLGRFHEVLLGFV
jgi:hypothetical protein